MPFGKRISRQHAENCQERAKRIKFSTCFAKHITDRTPISHQHTHTTSPVIITESFAPISFLKSFLQMLQTTERRVIVKMHATQVPNQTVARETSRKMNSTTKVHSEAGHDTYIKSTFFDQIGFIANQNDWRLIVP